MFNKYFNKRTSTVDSTNIKIALLYYIPKTNTVKYENWSDGFTNGIRLMERDYSVEWINLEDELPTSERLNKFDFIIAKCCWNSKIDLHLRSLKNLQTPRGIVISCSIVPKKKLVKFYDVLWFQTFWFGDQLPKHKLKLHSFGIDSKIFKPQKTKKTIDVLSIGAVTAYKRLHKIIDLPGKNKLVIGNTSMHDSKEIVEQLEANNITVRSYASQEELAQLINASKIVFIPCELNGGGERALLEGRSCGAKVVIENDNPKLKELLDAPIWNEVYYGQQIRKGIEEILDLEKDVFRATPIVPTKKLMVGKSSYHNGNLALRGDEHITIGAFCSFGKNISILTSNHDTNYLAVNGFVYRNYFDQEHPGEVNTKKNRERTKGPVHIGNDVWIGDDVKILSGVTIGDGACIAAGTIVTKDIAPFEIHAGVPNKKIKLRFPKEICTYIQELAWWSWSDKLIEQNSSLFQLNLNETSIKEIKQTLIGQE